MKLTMKLFLIVSLFCTVALADDGDMTTGNKSGEGSGGGLVCAECVVNEQPTEIKGFNESEDSVNEDDYLLMIWIRGFFDKFIG